MEEILEPNNAYNFVMFSAYINFY